MNMKIVAPVLVALLGGATAGFVATAKPEPQPQPPAAIAPPPVDTLRVVPEALPLTVRSQGSVRPRRQIDLVVQVGGTVTAVADSYRLGGRFEAGETLLQIDPRDYEIAVTRAQAAVADARQQLAVERGKARTAESEWRNLGSAEANSLFLRKPQLASAQARLAAAEADLRKAELDLARTRVTAPFAGRVRAVQVDLGQYVTPGTPAATVYDIQAIEVALPLSGRDLTMLGLTAAAAQSDELAIPVRLHGRLGGQPATWDGVIRRTAATIDAQTRMLDAIAELRPEDAELPLMIGQFVEAEITGRTLEHVVRVPVSAVRARDRIWTVDEQHTLTIRDVEVLRQDGDLMLVRAPLAGPMQVVTSYLASVQDGMTVAPGGATEVVSGAGR